MSNFFSSSLEKKEIKRFDRQMRLPGWNQTALKESVVLIAGVGGLGCEIAKNLAMAGVGTIHLVDMDTIEYSNLNRQLLFYNAKEGTPKSKAAAETLGKLNPFSKYISHFGPLEELEPRIFKNVDLRLEEDMFCT